MSHGALGKLRQPMPRNFLGNITLCQAVVRDQYICDVRRRDLLADAAEILVWGLAANGLRDLTVSPASTLRGNPRRTSIMLHRSYKSQRPDVLH
jgi:hypothetical protein